VGATEAESDTSIVTALSTVGSATVPEFETIATFNSLEDTYPLMVEGRRLRRELLGKLCIQDKPFAKSLLNIS